MWPLFLSYLMNKTIITFLLSLFASLSVSAQFQSGGDISLVPQYEKVGVKHKDKSGEPLTDVIDYLHSEANMSLMRVRLFVNPTVSATPGGIVQDLDYVTALGKRIKDKGLQFMLDFHYSDTWADPASQTIPASWASLSEDELKEKVYTYTKECLEHLVANGATPDYVQVGNEVSYGMLWRNTNDKCYTTTSQTSSSTQWKRFCGFLSQGAKAVREVIPAAKVVVHIERAAESAQTTKFYQFIEENKVDYDVIGLSYYPFWHNNLTTLGNTLSALQISFPTKEVQIVETAYYHNWYPSDAKYNFTSQWPATAAGQAQFITDLFAELAKHSNVTAAIYWCPEEAGNGPSNSVMSGWMNRGFWWEDSQWPVGDAIWAWSQATASSINTAEANSSLNTMHSSLYNLAGQRVGADYKGLRIVNGKKYFSK